MARNRVSFKQTTAKPPYEANEARRFHRFCSPKLSFRGKKAYKKFTALARVKEGDVYQGDMGGGFMPYRRDVEFLRCEGADILPLIPQLTFIHNKRSWGFVFRFGFFEIARDDFERIAKSMKKKLNDLGQA